MENLLGFIPSCDEGKRKHGNPFNFVSNCRKIIEARTTSGVTAPTPHALMKVLSGTVTVSLLPEG